MGQGCCDDGEQQPTAIAETGPGREWGLGPMGRLRMEGDRADAWIFIFAVFRNTLLPCRSPFPWIHGVS